MDFQTISSIVEFAAAVLTIVASGIAIYVYFFNREKIASAIDFLLNYSQRVTLTELKYKLERLNDYTANDPTQKQEIINILHEFEGQVKGNVRLKEQLSPQMQTIKKFTDDPKFLTEPKKRSIVSELRESLRNLDTSNYREIMKSKVK